jgi:hypothetical protein
MLDEPGAVRDPQQLEEPAAERYEEWNLKWENATVVLLQ